MTSKVYTASERAVTFVSSSTQSWGAETSIGLIATCLMNRGFSVKAVAPLDAVARSLVGGEVQRATTEVRPKLATGHLQRMKEMVSVARAAKKAGAVLVFCSVNLYPFAVLCRALQCKVVLDVHDSLLDIRSRVVLGSGEVFANDVICISDYVRALGIRRRAKLVPRPILTSSPPQLGEGKHVHAIGIVGRIAPEKRVDLAIQAIQPLKSCSLLVYGAEFGREGKRLRAELQEMAEELAPGRVKWCGRKPIQNILAEIGILVIANEHEASGRTAGEAMAAGVAVVVPSAGGAKEFVEDNVSGFVWDVCEASAGITDAIRRVIDADSEGRLDSIKRAAFIRVSREHDMRLVGDLYAAALESVL